MTPTSPVHTHPHMCHPGVLGRRPVLQLPPEWSRQSTSHCASQVQGQSTSHRASQVAGQSTSHRASQVQGRGCPPPSPPQPHQMIKCLTSPVQRVAGAVPDRDHGKVSSHRHDTTPGAGRRCPCFCPSFGIGPGQSKPHPPTRRTEPIVRQDHDGRWRCRKRRASMRS